MGNPRATRNTENLSKIIHELGIRIKNEEVEHQPRTGEPLSAEPLAEGVRYEVAILTLDAVNHTEIMRRNPGRYEKVSKEYRALVQRIASSYGGRNWRWEGDGGFWAFWGPRRRERAVLAGITLLGEMTTFNLDREVNLLDEPLTIRIAAGCGELEYSENKGEISALVISHTVKLQGRTRAGGFNISDSIFLKMDDRLQETFSLIDQDFRGSRIYSYNQERRKGSPSISDMKKSMTRLKNSVAEAMKICISHQRIDLDKTHMVKLSTHVTECYAGFEEFLTWFANIDKHWSDRYVQSLVAKNDSMIKLEDELWSALKIFFISVGTHENAELRLMQEHVRDRHATVDFGLNHLRHRFLQAIDPNVKTEGVLTAIEKFVAVEDLDRVAAFVVVISHETSEVVKLLTQGSSLRSKFLELLWSLVDLVLVEDSCRAEMWRGTGEYLRLFEALSSAPGLSPRFHVLARLLDDDAPTVALVQTFRKWGLDPTYLDIEVAWRAIVAAHSNYSVRQRASLDAPLDALWQTVVYRNAPLEVLYFVAHRLVEDKESGRTKGDDLQRIFFDCINPRLIRAINEEDDAGKVKMVGLVIDELFNFNFFVENPYFRYLEALFSLFHAKAPRLGVRLSAGEVNLNDFRIRQVSNRRLPEGVMDLPLAIQRHLAKHGAYIELFFCHQDDRIASEVAKYADDEGLIERVVSYCLEQDVVPNRRLFESLPLDKQEAVKNEFDRQTGGDKSGGKETYWSRWLKRKLSPADIESLKRSQRATKK